MFVVCIVLCVTGVTLIDGNQSQDDDEASKYGTFWQVADIHYDSNYSSPLVAPNLCRVADGFRNSSMGKAGKFGDYACDSAWPLVVSGIEAMKSLAPTPNFILWTGDSIPHVSDDFINLEKIYDVIRNITDKLKETFPGVPIYPMLGNHDIWPANQLPGTDNALFYDDMLTKTGWSQLLSPEEQKVFKIGGYYSKSLGGGLRLVCLNSNLWYVWDKFSQNETDPAGQFHWLELEMQNAKNMSEKVILSGHVPPGVLGRAEKGFWMAPLFNKRLFWLLQRFSDVIKAAIFGHEHTDAFRIVYDADGKPVMPVFLAPAITPWNSTLSGMGSNNPALRLYHYSRKSGNVVDYTQYYLNLTDANARENAKWDVEYKATKAFDLQNVSADNLDRLVAKFKENGSSLFQRYYEYNSVSLDRSLCVDDCKRRHICSMTNIEFTDYSKCFNISGDAHPVVQSTTSGSIWHHKSTTHDHHHHHEIGHYTYFLLGGILAFLVVLFLIVAFCCCHRRHAVVLMGRSKYVLIREV